MKAEKVDHRKCHLSRCRSRSLAWVEACRPNLDFQQHNLRKHNRRDTSKKRVQNFIQITHRRQRDISTPLRLHVERHGRSVIQLAEVQTRALVVRPMCLETVSPPKEAVMVSQGCHLKHQNIDKFSIKNIIIAIGGVITSATGRTAEPHR